jgi:hypothetical protein
LGSLESYEWAPTARAAKVMPPNISASRVTITVSVVRAFFHSGGWKAGTPSLIASTPVSAVHPEAKALSSRKMLTLWTVCSSMGVAAWRFPAPHLIPITVSMRKIPAMKR